MSDEAKPSKGTKEARKLAHAADIAFEGAAQQLERTAATSADGLRLAFGEMTAQEIRTVRAVLNQQATVIRSLRPLPTPSPQ